MFYGCVVVVCLCSSCSLIAEFVVFRRCFGWLLFAVLLGVVVCFVGLRLCLSLECVIVVCWLLVLVVCVPLSLLCGWFCVVCLLVLCDVVLCVVLCCYVVCCVVVFCVFGFGVLCLCVVVVVLLCFLVCCFVLCLYDCS